MMSLKESITHKTLCEFGFSDTEKREINFLDETVGMKKEEREAYYFDNYN